MVSWVFPFVLIYLNFWKNTNCPSISFKLSHWFKIHCFGLWRSWILVLLSRKQDCYWFCYLNLSSVWTYENYIFCLHQGQRNPGWHGLINQHSLCTFTESTVKALWCTHHSTFIASFCPQRCGQLYKTCGWNPYKTVLCYFPNQPI